MSADPSLEGAMQAAYELCEYLRELRARCGQVAAQEALVGSLEPAARQGVAVMRTDALPAAERLARECAGRMAAGAPAWPVLLDGMLRSCRESLGVGEDAGEG